MTQKKRLAIIAGDLPQQRFLALFEVLRSEFEATFYMLGDDDFISTHESGIRCKVFSKVPNMPGYMRDLESEIANTDCIIGLETSRMTTFQAIRTARKFHIPAGVIVTESQPFFYEKYSNIRAVQYDICRSATFFWATSQAAQETLQLDGVPTEKISQALPPISQTRFRQKSELRRKFRSYVGIPNEDIIILCRSDLETHYHLENILESLKHLREQGTPSALRLKILFVGDGAGSKDLKFKAVDRGLGSSLMFLHQDPEPFLCDLLNASDFYLVPGGVSPHRPEEYPLAILEAMSCGVIPIVPAGSVAAELCKGIGFTFSHGTGTTLTSSIFRALNDLQNLPTLSNQAMEYVKNDWNSSERQAAFLHDVMNLTWTTQSHKSSRKSPRALIQEVESLVQSGAELDALIQVEEAELHGIDSIPCQAELARLKGDALYNLGRINEAMDAYTKSMHLDDNNPDCLRGLGFIAWHGHSNEEALTFFKKALAIRESDVSSTYGIGLVYRRLGLLDEAVYWLERCVLQSNAPASAVVALAQSCAQLTPRSRSIATLEKTIEVVGEQKALLATLGQLYLAEGHIEEGKELLEKAMLVGSTPAA